MDVLEKVKRLAEEHGKKKLDRPRQYAQAILDGKITLDDVPEEWKGLVNDHVEDAQWRRSNKINKAAHAICAIHTREGRMNALMKVEQSLRADVKAKCIEIFDERKRTA